MTSGGWGSGNEISALRETPASPSPPTTCGPGREVPPGARRNPPLRHLALPASRAVGGPVLTLVGAQPHKSSVTLVPGREQRPQTLHRPGSRAGAGGREGRVRGDGLGSAHQRQQLPDGQRQGRAQREEGVPILLHHFVRRAARNTSPSPGICPRRCIAQTGQLQLRLRRGQPPGRPCW